MKATKPTPVKICNPVKTTPKYLNREQILKELSFEAEVLDRVHGSAQPGRLTNIERIINFCEVGSRIAVVYKEGRLALGTVLGYRSSTEGSGFKVVLLSEHNKRNYNIAIDPVQEYKDSEFEITSHSHNEGTIEITQKSLEDGSKKIYLTIRKT